MCLSLLDWAPFRITKAAIKLHTLLDLRGNIPSFIHISDGKLHDVNVLDILSIEADAFYVMDRGYVDFARLYAMHQSGAFFVTRAKSNINARRVYSAPLDKTVGLNCDQPSNCVAPSLFATIPNICAVCVSKTQSREKRCCS